MIRDCGEADFGAIYAIINDAAIAYKGVIPADRWHDPYMPLVDLENEIADGIVQQVNVPGADVFEGPLNAFDVLVHLRDALNANEVTEVRASLTQLSDMRERISTVRGEIGARVNRMELTRNVLDRVSAEMTSILSEDEDVDLTATIVNLQQEQDVFQAALASGASIIPQSLMDFIG